MRLSAGSAVVTATVWTGCTLQTHRIAGNLSQGFAYFRLRPSKFLPPQHRFNLGQNGIGDDQPGTAVLRQSQKALRHAAEIQSGNVDIGIAGGAQHLASGCFAGAHVGNSPSHVAGLQAARFRMAFAKGQNFFKLTAVLSLFHGIADQFVQSDMFLVRYFRARASNAWGTAACRFFSESTIYISMRSTLGSHSKNVKELGHRCQ
jgi:hypothetical protein